MIRETSSIESIAPIERVWSYLSNPYNQLELSPNFLTMELPPDGPPGLGVHFRGRLKVFGMVTFVFDQFEEGRMFRLKTDPWVGQLTHRFELMPTDGKTRVFHVVELAPKGLVVRAMAPLLRVAIKHMLVDLDRQMLRIFDGLAQPSQVVTSEAAALHRQ